MPWSVFASVKTLKLGQNLSESFILASDVLNCQFIAFVAHYAVSPKRLSSAIRKSPVKAPY
jgi:hypothetical protein